MVDARKRTSFPGCWRWCCWAIPKSNYRPCVGRDHLPPGVGIEVIHMHSEELRVNVLAVLLQDG